MADPLLDILQRLGAGDLDPDQAAELLRRQASQPLGFATVDHDRLARCGAAEVIFAEHKTAEQVVAIAGAILERQAEAGVALVTRTSAGHV